VRVCPQRSKFLRIFSPRYYMLWQDDVYSMGDLKQVSSGSLLRWMQITAAAAEQHVMTCATCSAFGHFCEICRSDALLFSFQVHMVAQCGRCKGFFHSACLRSVGPNCPRCARRRDKADTEHLVNRVQRMQVLSRYTPHHNLRPHLLPANLTAPQQPLPPPRDEHGD
jgi:hypothetical protein